MPRKVKNYPEKKIYPIHAVQPFTDFPTGRGLYHVHYYKTQSELNDMLKNSPNLLNFLQGAVLGFKARVDHTLSPLCSGFHGFTFGATPAELLVASVVTIEFFTSYTKMPILAFLSLLHETKKKNPVIKRYPLWE